jgi:hypothetical protein
VQTESALRHIYDAKPANTGPPLHSRHGYDNKAATISASPTAMPVWSRSPGPVKLLPFARLHPKNRPQPSPIFRFSVVKASILGLFSYMFNSTADAISTQPGTTAGLPLPEGWQRIFVNA